MKNQTDQSIRARLANPRNKLARFYDDGGPIDRYTAAYLAQQSKAGGRHWFMYRGMSAHPFHPQGFGCSGESAGSPVDYPVARLGRRNHLGKRIRFADLPPDCQKLVVQDLLA